MGHYFLDTQYLSATSGYKLFVVQILINGTAIFKSEITTFVTPLVLQYLSWKNIAQPQIHLNHRNDLTLSY